MRGKIQQKLMYSCFCVCETCVVQDCCKHHSYTVLLCCCWWSLHSCPVITTLSILKHFGSSMAALDNVMCGDQSKAEEKSLLLPSCKGACYV